MQTVPMHLLSNVGFAEPLSCSGLTSLMGVNGTLPCIFFIIKQSLVKSHVRGVHYNLLSNTEFYKNRTSRSHTLLRGVNKVLFVDSTHVARYG